MAPYITVHIPWWIWISLILFTLSIGAWAVLTEPDPEPSFKNHIRHLITIWARHSQNPQRSRSPPPSNPPRSSPGFESRGEQICRAHMESRFGVPFKKARPDFLKNPVTGENLELDVFNEDLCIGVEYNGKQHYHFNSHFHQSSTDRFQNQQYRDLIKKQLCQENGVTLIIVPYWIPDDEIPEFINQQLPPE